MPDSYSSADRAHSKHGAHNARHRRRRSWRVAVIAALSLAACGQPAPVRRIVLISVDTLRPDHLGCYGYARDTSPRLDRLAREGTFFKSAVSTSSWTLPAHMSMLTGLVPEAHGVQKRHKSLDPARPLFPEILQEAGFRTAGFVSGAFVDQRYGFARGFETYQNFWESESDAFHGVEPGADLTATLARLQDEADRASYKDCTGPEVVTAAIEWLEARSEQEPFFLFVHLWEPHYDYIPPPPYDTLFAAPRYAGSLRMENYFDNADVRAGMPPEDLAYVVSQYDGEIAFTDALIGRLLDALDALAIANETLVIVTSDHGEEFFEHGRKGHRTTLYDESILVPLIARGPGVAANPSGIERQASLIDIAPTILRAAGLGPHPEMMGEDLSPALAGSAGGTARAAAPSPESSTLRPAPHALSQLVLGDETGDACARFSIRSPAWKSIVDCDDRSEVYDLAHDPGERESVAADRGGEAAAILRSGETMRAAVRAFARSLPRQGSAPVVIDPKLEERLRSLGYVD